MTIRVGLTGIQNSHAEAIIDCLNVAQQLPNIRVAAICGGDAARIRQLATLGRIPTVVKDSIELVGVVDAVIVCDRDGARHRAVATPFLEQGMPVYVDKPFTCGVDDAHELLETAKRHRALLTSYSPLRYAPEVIELAEIADGLQDAYTVEVTGPADPASPYGGIFFYDSHHADMALRLAPGTIGWVQVERSEDGYLATVRAGLHHVVLRFEQPTDCREFRIRLNGQEATAERRLSLGSEIFRPGLQVFFDAMRIGAAPLTGDELIRPVELLARVAEQLTVVTRAEEWGVGCD